MDQILYKLPPNARVVFLCSGNCANEIEYILMLKRFGIVVAYCVFVDTLYEHENLHDKIQPLIPGVDCLFLNNFHELFETLLSSTEQYDLFVSFGFQISFDINQDAQKHHQQCLNTALYLRQIGSVYGSIPWFAFNLMALDVTNPEIKSGGDFVAIGNRLINSLPQYFLKKENIIV